MLPYCYVYIYILCIYNTHLVYSYVYLCFISFQALICFSCNMDFLALCPETVFLKFFKNCEIFALGHLNHIYLDTFRRMLSVSYPTTNDHIVTCYDNISTQEILIASRLSKRNI